MAQSNSHTTGNPSQVSLSLSEAPTYRTTEAMASAPTDISPISLKSSESSRSPSPSAAAKDDPESARPASSIAVYQNEPNDGVSRCTYLLVCAALVLSLTLNAVFTTIALKGTSAASLRRATADERINIAPVIDISEGTVQNNETLTVHHTQIKTVSSVLSTTMTQTVQEIIHTSVIESIVTGTPITIPFILPSSATPVDEAAKSSAFSSIFREAVSLKASEASKSAATATTSTAASATGTLHARSTPQELYPACDSKTSILWCRRDWQAIAEYNNMLDGIANLFRMWF